jgi:hypothetical protein
MTAFAWLCIGVLIGAFCGWHHGYKCRLREDQDEWRREHAAEMRRIRFYGNIIRRL